MIEHARVVATRLKAHLPRANWVRMAEARARMADGPRARSTEIFSFRRTDAPYTQVERGELLALYRKVNHTLPPLGDNPFTPSDYGRHLREQSEIAPVMVALAAWGWQENLFDLGRLAYGAVRNIEEMVQFMRLLGIRTNFSGAPILADLGEWDDFYAFVRGYLQSCLATPLPPLSVLDIYDPKWNQPVGIREIFQAVGIDDPQAYLAALKPLGWEERYWHGDVP